MANPAGESNDEVLKLDFDRRLMLQFRGSVVTSDAGLLAYRELDDALGLSTIAGETLADACTGRNGPHDAEGTSAAELRSSMLSVTKMGRASDSAERSTPLGRIEPDAAGIACPLQAFAMLMPLMMHVATRLIEPKNRTKR
jgi:hypothetical protein